MDGRKEGKSLSLASGAYHLLKDTDTHPHDKHKFQSSELCSRYTDSGLDGEVMDDGIMESGGR